MYEKLRDAFDKQAEAWDAYTETPLGRLREELNWIYLAEHLPRANYLSHVLRVLDAGAGTGGLAMRVARRGHEVVLLDMAPAMLRLARRRAEQAGVNDRIEYLVATAEGSVGQFGSESFDVLVCHTLLEFVPAPGETVRELGQLLRPGGIFSIVFVNRYADALRLAVAKGDLVTAREALTSDTSTADLFGVPRQTFELGAIRSMLDVAGIEVVAEYGVRIFGDYIADPAWKEDDAEFEKLVALEVAAAQRFPYCHIGRYRHVIGRRR